jgi:hypothetical protein
MFIQHHFKICLFNISKYIFIDISIGIDICIGLILVYCHNCIYNKTYSLVTVICEFIDVKYGQTSNGIK